MILLAFLLPFSIYLLLLGNLNRRPHPVLVPGTWDFAGVLFAASGFLLVVGPAVISSGSEGWRMFWLFGARAGLPAVDEGAARTRFLHVGDTIEIEARDGSGWSPFGAIHQRVVAP